MTTFAVTLLWRSRHCPSVVLDREVVHVEARSEARARALARAMLRTDYAPGGEVVACEVAA